MLSLSSPLLRRRCNPVGYEIESLMGGKSVMWAVLRLSLSWTPW